MIIEADKRLMFKSVIDENGFGIDFSKTTIHPEYDEYIKQLEAEVKILRVIASHAIDDHYIYTYELPPQAPEWRG